ncbi:MAG: hypothetical protein DSY80_06190 [Desulfocapsa sp.]|nr:MAG: hypothetical protein DSY80_06190 [Desulfocapsa sp.]
MVETQAHQAVIVPCPGWQQQAEQLAAKLGLQLARPENRYPLILRYCDTGLELVKNDDPSLAGPVRVDFTSGSYTFRRRCQKRELLIRAVGVKADTPLDILDGTGGLGRDGFMLAAAGCRVHIFEREPIIAALLADGLKRARSHPKTAAICRRIQLTHGDVLEVLETMQQTGRQVDVIYLDPMFPQRKKSAKVKKEARMLQLLAPVDDSSKRLLEAALTAAAKRVVVKRPLRAPCLSPLSPSHSHNGTTIRFDVYLTGSGRQVMSVQK